MIEWFFCYNKSTFEFNFVVFVDYYNKYEKPLMPEGENVQKLWQPNNVFIYKIHDIELRCTSKCHTEKVRE